MALKVTINGNVYEAEKDECILSVCRRNDIFVPTLCHHESLSGLGTCRLCVVEVNESGTNKVVVSCVYPLNRDCEVFTESKKIIGIRKTILSMLRVRAPEAEGILPLCEIYGVEEDSPAVVGSDNSAEKRLVSACILCGLCVQACACLGTGAISTVGRGVEKKISTPYGEPSVDCVGCGSCAAVCPAKAIECTESGGKRTIWGRDFTLLNCALCGRAFATNEEYSLALKGASLAEPPLCEVCRKKKSADVLAAAFGERTATAR